MTGRRTAQPRSRSDTEHSSSVRVTAARALRSAVRFLTWMARSWSYRTRTWNTTRPMCPRSSSLQRGVADAVFGSRLAGGRPQRAYLFWHRIGNRFLSLLTGVLFNTTLSDMETGYKAFRSDVLRSLRLTQDDFAIEPEITGEVCRRGLRIYEMPISYYGRTYAEGKKITWRDGFKAIGVLLAVRLRRR